MRQQYLEWCDLFFSKAIQPMSKELFKYYVNISVNEMNNIPVSSGIKELPAFGLIKSRAEAIGLDCNDHVLFVILLLSPSPGTIVMYLSALRSKGKQFNMEKFSTVFPNGFLSPEDLSFCWSKQKIDYNNMLDYLEIFDSN